MAAVTLGARRDGAPVDKQRARVYRWEARVTKGANYAGTLATLDEVRDFMQPIWRAERGRYGRANQPPPALRDGRGARIARGGAGFLKLPKWSRNPWVILHEMAHELVGGGTGWHSKGGAHGERFVGCLIGMAARHLGYEASDLMAAADECGVKYDMRSIGSVPIQATNPAALLVRALREERPMTEMELACWCDLTYLQVRGAALGLIRHGKARWLRKKLVAV